MWTVFVDTFFWIAVTNPRDQARDNALALQSKLVGAQFVTTVEVLTEFLNFYSKMGPELRKRASAFVRGLQDMSSLTVIEQSRESFLAGLELYESRLDKGYSATDCISMQTMKRESISEALTGDGHFAQEGFRGCKKKCVNGRS